MKTACECTDAACSAHPGVAKCAGLGLIILRNVDMPDSQGTA